MIDTIITQLERIRALNLAAEYERLLIDLVLRSMRSEHDVEDAVVTSPAAEAQNAMRIKQHAAAHAANVNERRRERTHRAHRSPLVPKIVAYLREHRDATNFELRVALNEDTLPLAYLVKKGTLAIDWLPFDDTRALAAFQGGATMALYRLADESA